IASHHPKAIVAGREICVEGLSTIAGILPIRVVPFELIAKANFLWCDETERGKVDFQIARERRQPQAPIAVSRYLIEFSVGGDLFDMHRRGKVVVRQMSWIDNAHAVSLQKQNLSIGGLRNHRRVAARDLV